MFELGQMLRKARLEQDISLDDLQELTKIRKRYLEAIEDGQFKVLPGSFYVRAFIKSYAEAVGLDPGEVLQLYGNSIPQPDPESTVEAPVKSRRTNFKVTDRWNKWATRVMVWSFLLLIIGIIYYFINMNTKPNESRRVSEEQNVHLTDRRQSEVESPAPQAKAEQENALALPTPTPAPTPTPVPEVKLLRSENGTDFYQITRAANVSVKMNIVGEKCWIQIDKINSTDNPVREMIEQGTLFNGNEKTWDVDKSVYITLGAANAVNLMVNGTVIPVGDSANVRRFEFDLPNT